MDKFIKKYSPNMDQTSYVKKDIAPEKVVRVFPYELAHTDSSRVFIQDNTSSIAYITQDNFLNSDEHNLMLDENNNYYFEVVSDEFATAILDESETSTYGKELKVESAVSVASNYYYNPGAFKPMIASIGHPLTLNEKGFPLQIVYLVTNITSSQKYEELKKANVAKYSMKSNAEFAFDLLRIEALEAQYTNSKLHFTFNSKMNKSVSAFDGSSGLTLGIENHMLISSIKAKGSITEIDSNGNESAEEFGDINLIASGDKMYRGEFKTTAERDKFATKPNEHEWVWVTDEAKAYKFNNVAWVEDSTKTKLDIPSTWAPFKFTPTSISEKLTMYADWFDYDNALPFIYINKFKQGSTLSTIITSQEDLKMIEDMLIVSAGFASSWDAAPVLTTGSEAGKIDPKFRVGHSGIKVSVIAGKDPLKVVDGIYENHIRKHPAFETTPERFQPAKAIINALSRYIYSSYAIGKGQNSFNQAYLPWYLEPYPTTPIDFNRDQNDHIVATQITNPDAGGTGPVNTYLLDKTVKFQSKSLYFHSKYSSNSPVKGQPDLLLPTKINLSSQKLLQTDRKLTLPEVPVVMQPITKLPLPGDIDTKSSQDLSYIWYLPIQDQTKFEEFMLNTKTIHTSIAPGTDVTITLNGRFKINGKEEVIVNGVGIDGKIWNIQEADAFTIEQQAGIIKTHTLINQVDSSKKDVQSRGNFPHIDDWGTYQNSNSWIFWSDDVIRRKIAKRFGYENYLSVKLDKIGDGNSDVFSFSHTVSHSEFSPATVTTTSQTVWTTSYTEREIIFDKQQWEKFLTKFDIIPSGFNRYNFETIDNFKIKKIDEITIQSVWGNEIELFFGTGPNDRIVIESVNADNEGISTQSIIFT